MNHQPQISLPYRTSTKAATTRFVDRLLFWFVVTVLFAVVAFEVVISITIRDDALLPAGTLGHFSAVLGTTLMLLGLSYSLAKRTRFLRGTNQWWQTMHILLGSSGVLLVVLHSVGRLTKPPAMLLLVATGICVVGLFGRFISGHLKRDTFAMNPRVFYPMRTPTRPSFSTIVEQKASIIAAIGSSLPEEYFGLNPLHWLTHPLLALRFSRLFWRERRLVGKVARVEVDVLVTIQAFWRFVHIGFFGLIVLGLIAHVMTTLFFAGYVAEGSDVYWWHLRR